ncbi:hypothetical protein Slala03_05980 [Streptomyces lavendulae subsp. lavendulae]|nr:hypothetical protein Slala03_05980 [Streptomyces lavendulae subsp. lavendulae]
MRRARHEPVIPVAFPLCVPALSRAPGKEKTERPLPVRGPGGCVLRGDDAHAKRPGRSDCGRASSRRAQRGGQARRATPSAFAAAATAAVTASATRSSNGEGIT